MAETLLAQVMQDSSPGGASPVAPTASTPGGASSAEAPRLDERLGALCAKLRAFQADGGDTGDFMRVFRESSITEEEFRACGLTWGQLEHLAGTFVRVPNRAHGAEGVLRDVHRVALSLGRLPRAGEYESLWRRLGGNAHRRRWGHPWENCLQAYRSWLRTNGLPVPGEDPPAPSTAGACLLAPETASTGPGPGSLAPTMPTHGTEDEPAAPRRTPARPTSQRPERRYPRTVIAPTTIGRPLVDDVMLTEPTNELGVILLLGQYARALGITILHISASFPDVLLMRADPAGGNAVLAAYEVELRSRAYRDHGHLRDARARNVAGILCWEHDWDSCPRDLDVIELKSLIASLRRDRRSEAA